MGWDGMGWDEDSYLSPSSPDPLGEEALTALDALAGEHITCRGAIHMVMRNPE